ncbi:hypothetical protein BV494_22590 (plasmid) [Rahnella sikkimica]|uniref:Uncharacterized protein n=1 Tax=Rahnella sikkimica TaxID=1805933 RepID=A0A2L1UXY9_9GAMM|nr:hypothetical protein BV494_22590 [Rahnella sikkimica]
MTHSHKSGFKFHVFHHYGNNGQIKHIASARSFSSIILTVRRQSIIIASKQYLFCIAVSGNVSIITFEHNIIATTISNHGFIIAKDK